MKLNLKSKLLLLTLVPTSIIVVLSLNKVIYEYKIQKNLQEVKHQITHANLISDIVHLLQIERGLSVGYIASSQKVDNYAIKLVRKDLDRTLKNINKHSCLNGYLGLDFLNTLSTTRKSIDSFELSAPQAKNYYTNNIDTLLDFVKAIPTNMQDLEDRNYIQAYSYISSAKEQLGRIRATLHEVFINKKLSQSHFMQIRESLNIYNASTKRFEKMLYKYPEFLSFYHNNLENKILKETFRIIYLAIEEVGKNDIDIDSAHWFDLATHSINLFKEVIEDRLFLDVNNSINKKIENSKNMVLFVSITLSLLLIIISIFMYTIVKKILSSAHMLNEEFESSMLLLEQYKFSVDKSFIVSKTDPKGIIRYVNDEFCNISGYSREDLIGKPHNIIRHPDMPKELFSNMWHTIKNLKKPWIGSIKNRTKDGSAYWMKVFISPIINKNGDVIEYIAMRVDITDLENEKERIRNTLGIVASDFAEARHLATEYENAMSSTWSIIRTDVNNNIRYVNDTFSKLSGYQLEELIGVNCTQLRHNKHIQSKECENLKNALQKKEIVKMQFENISKDKKSYFVDATIIPISSSNGVIVEHLHLMCDITELVQLHAEVEQTQREIIFRMGEICETRSKETGHHVRRVAEYSRLLALKAGFDEKEANLIADASPMHDIGKVAIADTILLKPSSLDNEEWEIMRSHSSIGHKVLKGSKRLLLNAAATIANEHHEKYDGSGYPNAIAGENINIYARIVAIADVFDALGSDRVYKKAWELDKILNFFKEQKGKHFDPNLVELFLKNINEFLNIRDTYRD